MSLWDVAIFSYYQECQDRGRIFVIERLFLIPIDYVDKIAVTIPCLNEEKTIGKVIADFKRGLPEAAIYVIDNGSTDRTAEIAVAEGTSVIHEPRLGKGYAVESIFAAIPEEFVIMVDGDDTYPAERVKELLLPVLEGRADMTVGSRMMASDKKAFRKYHGFGNVLITSLANKIFGSHLTDVLSGYRVFNRKVLRRIPVVSEGFEIETELTLQMLYYNLKIIEVPVTLRERPADSPSKLNTIQDGFRILWKMFSLLRAFKPMTFFGLMGLFFLFLGGIAGILPIHDYMTEPNHYVSHVPMAILSTGLCLVGQQCIFLGILLHAINIRFREMHNVLTR